jgi:two-component system LytT family response regulator
MDNNINIAVVDDESLARKRIVNFLTSLKKKFNIVECKNGLEAVKLLSESQIDILFLDIQMPELDGFEVIENLNADEIPIVIFVTAYDKFALKAFEIHAVDYLLKPFDDERFYSAFQHARELLIQKESNNVNREIVSILSERKNQQQNKFAERILVKSRGSIYFIKCDDITRIKAEGKYLDIYANKASHVIRRTMHEIEAKLNPDKFLRIHRSTIINIDRIKEIQHWYKNEYVFILNNDEKFISGSTYRKNLDKILGSE